MGVATRKESLPEAPPFAIVRRFNKRMRRGRFTRHLPVTLSWILGLGIWEIVGRISNKFVFASFSDTMVSFWDLLRNGVLLHHTAISLVELTIGFSVATVLGVAGGLTAGFSRTFREMTDNWVTVFLAVPFAAIFPILLVWFGLGTSSKIALAVFAGFQPIWLNTKVGVTTVDRNLVEMTTTFDGNWFRVIRSVVLPWCFPSLIEGMRMGLSRAFLGVIIGELLASRGGLGYLINISGQTLRINNLLAAVVVVTGITVFLSFLMKLIQHALVPWWGERI